MTASVLTATINPVQTDVTERHITYYGLVGVAAGDYAAGGGILSFGGTSRTRPRPCASRYGLKKIRRAEPVPVPDRNVRRGWQAGASS